MRSHDGTCNIVIQIKRADNIIIRLHNYLASIRIKIILIILLKYCKNTSNEYALAKVFYVGCNYFYFYFSLWKKSVIRCIYLNKTKITTTIFWKMYMNKLNYYQLIILSCNFVYNVTKKWHRAIENTSAWKFIDPKK